MKSLKRYTKSFANKKGLKVMGKKQYTFEKAVKRWNDLMFDLCREYCTIGTNYSENTDDWNISNANAELRDSDDEYERKMWRSEVGRLTRFINYYKPYIDGVRCTQGHCSQYDNHRG